MAVAAVSRDTMRSFSPPAATFLVVSVTATLSLVGWPLTDGAHLEMAGRSVLGRLQRIICGRSKFPRPHHPPDQLQKRRAPALRPLKSTKLA